MLEKMMQALSWIVNFSLLGEQGGATLGWGGCGWKCLPRLQRWSWEPTAQKWGGVFRNRIVNPPFRVLMNARLVSRSFLYTRTIQKIQRHTKTCVPPRCTGNYFTEIHKVLGHRGSLLLSNYRRDSSKFKIKVPFNKVKEVVKLCSSQCLSWRTECLDAL